jgi:hypothetical protein
LPGSVAAVKYASVNFDGPGLHPARRGELLKKLLIDVLGGNKL